MVLKERGKGLFKAYNIMGCHCCRVDLAVSGIVFLGEGVFRVGLMGHCAAVLERGLWSG